MTVLADGGAGLDPAALLPYLGPVDLIISPDAIPANVDEIPDGTFINVKVWAALQGVQEATVYSVLTRSARRRAEKERYDKAVAAYQEAAAAGRAPKTAPEVRKPPGLPLPGDMPPHDDKVGRVSVYKMSTYRQWHARRPGQAAGAGRPRGIPRARANIKLPIDCPHCHQEITPEDMLEAARAAATAAVSVDAAG